jgi:hypothetical protein
MPERLSISMQSQSLKKAILGVSFFISQVFMVQYVLRHECVTRITKHISINVCKRLLSLSNIYQFCILPTVREKPYNVLQIIDDNSLQQYDRKRGNMKLYGRGKGTCMDGLQTIGDFFLETPAYHCNKNSAIGVLALADEECSTSFADPFFNYDIGGSSKFKAFYLCLKSCSFD